MVLAQLLSAAQPQHTTESGALPVAQRGLRCPGGGRAIGDPVGKTYILQELQIVSRDGEKKTLGFIYSGADGVDYIDLKPSDPHSYVHVMGDSELDKTKTMMIYCFSEPWHA